MTASGGEKVLAVVPARGGSTGVVDKNLRLVGGISLVARAVGCGVASACVDLTVVSTDDRRIGAEAQRCGAHVLWRPNSLATNEAPTDPVVVDAVGQLGALGLEFDVVVLLQPTSPLRLAEDVDEAVANLLSKDVDTVISVCQLADYHPARMYKQDGELLLPLSSEPQGRRRQDLPPVFHRNGAVYCTWVSGLLVRGSILGPRIGAFVMPRSRSVNIDEPIDLLIAEALSKA